MSGPGFQGGDFGPGQVEPGSVLSVGVPVTRLSQVMPATHCFVPDKSKSLQSVQLPCQCPETERTSRHPCPRSNQVARLTTVIHASSTTVNSGQSNNTLDAARGNHSLSNPKTSITPHTLQSQSFTKKDTTPLRSKPEHGKRCIPRPCAACQDPEPLLSIATHSLHV